MSYLLKFLLHVGAPDVLNAILGHGRCPRHGKSLLVTSSVVAETKNNNCNDSMCLDLIIIYTVFKRRHDLFQGNS